MSTIMETIKRVTVTFDFDPKEEMVSNMICFVDGVEKTKKTTTTKATKPKAEVVLEDEAVLVLEPTKISFNNKAVAIIGIEYGDRLVVKYEKLKGVKTPFPIIGKDLSFGEEGSGNKITKTNTIVYRGKANTILAEYGTEFGLEEYKEGVWKLISKNEGIKPIPTKDKEYKEVQEDAEKVDVKVFTDEDDTVEIGEMSFKL